MTVPCLLCGNHSPLRFQVREYDIHRCSQCDFEFVFPTPSAEAVAQVYQSGYFCGDGHGYADYFERERSSNRLKAEHRLDRLTELGLPSGARLLDVGCADGTFVAVALERGFDAYGVEVSSEALARMPGELTGRVFPSLAAAAGMAYDAVTMWDVLEHFATPVTTLREAVSLMRSRGWFGIVVPVIDNFNARHWPATWDQYKPPEHLSFFSSSSLRALLEREVGEVRFAEVAWRRESRLIAVGAARVARALRLVAAAEAAITRALISLRVLPKDWADDSVALYAQRR